MMNVLMVAEKPSVALSIAKIFSDGNCRTSKGRADPCPISEYKANYRGQLANFKVTSTCGHIMSVDFPQEYKSWDPRCRMEALLLFSCEIEKKVKKFDRGPNQQEKMPMPEFLASLAKNCDFLILWLDCDRAGESICFEVIDVVLNSMRQHNPDGDFMDRVFRAKFSSFAEIDINKAMSELVKPNRNESFAIEIRQELDLRITAFTRFLTGHYRNKYGIVDYSTLISFGLCQTPTLALCVARHDEIVDFKPQPYWLLDGEIELPDGQRLNLQWTRDRQFDKSTAQQFLNKIQKFTEATIVEINETEHIKDKPVALNSFELYRAASNFLQISPDTTMASAQPLYTSGYSSYPRTETTTYPEHFEFEPILRELASRPEFAEFANQILTEGIDKPKNGVNKGDHPPITPTPIQRNGYGRWMPEADAHVYKYIAQHFLATLMRPCRYITKAVKFSLGEEEFVVHSNVVLDSGFTQILTEMSVHEDKEMKALLDGLQKGQKLPIKELKLVEQMTEPPDYLTESELITLMEQNRIGTDGSIPTHINKIYEHKYVTLEAGRKLVPTKLGIALVHAYQKVDPDLVSPTIRADMEKQLDLIAKGKANGEMIKKEILKDYKQKLENLIENIGLMDEVIDELKANEMRNYKPPSQFDGTGGSRKRRHSFD